MSLMAMWVRVCMCICFKMALFSGRFKQLIYCAFKMDYSCVLGLISFSCVTPAFQPSCEIEIHECPQKPFLLRSMQMRCFNKQKGW